MAKWFEKLTPFKAAVDAEKLNRSLKKVRSVCVHGDTDCVRCASDDFETNRKATRWETLDEMDIRRIIYSLPQDVTKILRGSGGSAILAGGYIRAVVGNEPINDIDIFVNSESLAGELAKDLGGYSAEIKDSHYEVREVSGNGKKIQIIWRYPFKEPYEVLESFDYTVAKGAIWFDKGTKKSPSAYKSICHERFYRDIARKMLVYDCEQDVERVESFLRMMKFSAYGYSVEPKSLAEVVAKTCLSLDLTKGFDGMLQQLEGDYKPGGSDQEWSDLVKNYDKPKPKPKPAPRTQDYSYGS